MIHPISVCLSITQQISNNEMTFYPHIQRRYILNIKDG